MLSNKAKGIIQDLKAIIKEELGMDITSMDIYQHEGSQQQAEELAEVFGTDLNSRENHHWVSSWPNSLDIDGARVEFTYHFIPEESKECGNCGEEIDQFENEYCDSCHEQLEAENEADKKHLEREYRESVL